MLTLRQLDEPAIRLLYELQMRRDFPPSELKGLSAILSMSRKGNYDVIGAYCGKEMVAYALLYCPKEGRVALLDYLGVEPQLRGRGIGSEFIRMLAEHYACTTDVLMIECERPKAAPDEDEARKRIRFYTHAGAQLTSVRIWLFGVEYSILVLPCAAGVAERNWAQQMLALYQQMLPKELFAQNVRLIRA